MAKQNRTESYRNAMIDFDNMEIVELEKESIKTYNLQEVLKRWAGIEGVAITFKFDETIEPDKES